MKGVELEFERKDQLYCTYVVLVRDDCVAVGAWWVKKEDPTKLKAQNRFDHWEEVQKGGIRNTANQTTHQEKVKLASTFSQPKALNSLFWKSTQGAASCPLK